MTGRAGWRAATPVGVAVLVALTGVVVGLWRPWAPALPAVTTDLATFPAEIVDAIAEYRAPRVAAGILARLLTVGVPVALVVLPAGRRLVARIAGGTRRPLLRAGLLAATISLLVWTAVLPLGAWAGLVQDGSWGLRTASASLWWRDRVLSGLLNAGLTGLIGMGLLVVVRWRPRMWGWHATWMLTGIVALVSFLWPVLVAPLFVPTRPLPPGPVRDAVVAVLDEAGMGDANIEVAEASSRTTRINALVTGLGPSRRVVLHDTLLERPIDEIEAVLAHELGHRLHRDVARGVLASAPGILLGALLLSRVLGSTAVQRRMGAVSAADPRMIAVAFAVIATMQAVSEPAVLWYSRQVEASADHTALTLSDDPAALIAIQRAFVVRDLAMPDPPAWQVALFSTHPPVGARIRYAAAYADRQAIPLPDLQTYRAAEEAIGVPWHRPA